VNAVNIIQVVTAANELLQQIVSKYGFDNSAGHMHNLNFIKVMISHT